MTKNLEILIFESFFFNLAIFERVKQDISYNISLFFIIVDLEIVLREYLGLAYLMKIQAFCIYKSIEVIMISKDKSLIFIAF